MDIRQRLFGYDIEAYEEQERERRQVRDDLVVVQQQIEMFNVPLWGYLKDTLDAIEKQGVDLMIGAPIEEVSHARERVKLARYLARIPERLEQQRAQLEASVEDEDFDSDE